MLLAVRLMSPVRDRSLCFTAVCSFFADTTHKNHAVEIVENSSLDYDAVVVVSGDGLIHEVFNGFLKHAQSDRAFCIPIVPIPAGSGNGLSLNLLGLQDGLDPRAAALNVLKGL